MRKADRNDESFQEFLMCVALKPDWTKVKLEAQKVRKNDFQIHLAHPCALWILDQLPCSSSHRSSVNCSPLCLRMRRCQPHCTRCRGGWLIASLNLLPCSGPWARWHRDLGHHHRSVRHRNNFFVGRLGNNHAIKYLHFCSLGSIFSYFFLFMSLCRTQRSVWRMSRPPNCLLQVLVNQTLNQRTKAPRPSPASSLLYRCPLVASRGSTVKMDPRQH